MSQVQRCSEDVPSKDLHGHPHNGKLVRRVLENLLLFLSGEDRVVVSS